MLAKLKSLLKSETAADIEVAIATIDMDELRAKLAEATSNRTALLLCGTDAEVVAAEKQIEVARLAVERAEAAKAELERRLVDSRAREAEAALRKRHADAVRARDAVVQRIETDYASAAKTILSVIAADAEATAAIRAVNHELWSEDQHGLGSIDTPSQAVWRNVYYGSPDLREWTALLSTPTTPDHGRPTMMPKVTT